MNSLTNKEREVFALVSSGLTTKEIASRLNLSHHTIESHRKNLLKKFQAKNSAELIQKIIVLDYQSRGQAKDPLFSI
jgi:DNA-binding CsgD family transcriptional regulator